MTQQETQAQVDRWYGLPVRVRYSLKRYMTQCFCCKVMYKKARHLRPAVPTWSPCLVCQTYQEPNPYWFYQWR